MGKKRRVLWIVGAAVALIAATVFVVNYNSTDAKVESTDAKVESTDARIEPAVGPIIEVLPVSWLKEGVQLGIAIPDNTGSPYQQFISLQIKSGASATRVKGFSEFEGKVEIKSESDALEFVRLNTSPKTIWPFHYWTVRPQTMMEVVSKAWDLKKICYGDARRAASMKAGSDGTYGVISSETAAKASLSKPKIQKTEDGFLVSRTVVTGKGLKFVPHLITESVSNSGAYKLIDKEPIRTGVLVQVDWALPYLF